MEIDSVRKKKRFFYKNNVYRKFGIDHKSFNEWLENEAVMRNVHDPKNKKNTSSW